MQNTRTYTRFYGPAELLSDYRNHGNCRSSIFAKYFTTNEHDMARRLGSDMTSVSDKNTIRRSEAYFKFLNGQSFKYDVLPWEDTTYYDIIDRQNVVDKEDEDDE